MVIEAVAINVKNLSIHLVPELPSSIEDRIQNRLGWEVYDRNNECTGVKSISQDASIVSTSEEIKALCVGSYGENYESIRSIGDAIKGVAKILKIKAVTRKLAKNVCIAAIVCESLPIKIKNPESINYKYRKDNSLEVEYGPGKFPDFSDNFYKHIHSKVFEFPEEFPEKLFYVS